MERGGAGFTLALLADCCSAVTFTSGPVLLERSHYPESLTPQVHLYFLPMGLSKVLRISWRSSALTFSGTRAASTVRATKGLNPIRNTSAFQSNNEKSTRQVELARVLRHRTSS